MKCGLIAFNRLNTDTIPFILRNLISRKAGISRISGFTIASTIGGGPCPSNWKLSQSNSFSVGITGVSKGCKNFSQTP